jgi:hypothetical protein
LNSELPPTPTTENRSHLSGEQDAVLLQHVLQRAGIADWDVLIVGDGSGNQWELPCGWAYVLIDRATRGRRCDWGGMSAGSINFAETMPYLHALNWYDQHGGGKERLKQQGTLKVHIITDSQVIARWGTQANGAEELPRKHAILFGGMRELRRLGYIFTFHWAPRLDSRFNWLADLLAGLSRRSFLGQIHPGRDETLAQQAMLALGQLQFQDPTTQEAINLYGLHPDG